MRRTSLEKMCATVLRPGLPVLSVAALLDDLRVDCPRWQVEGREWQVECARRRVAIRAAAAEDDAGCGVPVEIDLVDLGIEAVVVGAKRTQHAPHGGEAFVVIERGLGLNPRGHRDRKDDVAVLLALGLSHRPAYGLDDIDLAVPGAHEEHRVERRDVDAFGEATRVRENSAAPFGRAFQPLDSGLSIERVVLSVDMTGLAAEGRRLLDLREKRDRLPHDSVPVRLEPLGGVDGVGERDRAREGTDWTVLGSLVLGVLKRAPAADDLRGVGQIDLPAAGREVGLECGVHVALGHGEDDDPVVGQEVVFDRPGEGQAVELRSIGFGIVH